MPRESQGRATSVAGCSRRGYIESMHAQLIAAGYQAYFDAVQVAGGYTTRVLLAGQPRSCVRVASAFGITYGLVEGIAHVFDRHPDRGEQFLRDYDQALQQWGAIAPAVGDSLASDRAYINEIGLLTEC